MCSFIIFFQLQTVVWKKRYVLSLTWKWSPYAISSEEKHPWLVRTTSKTSCVKLFEGFNHYLQLRLEVQFGKYPQFRYMILCYENEAKHDRLPGGLHLTRDAEALGIPSTPCHEARVTQDLFTIALAAQHNKHDVTHTAVKRKTIS